MSVELSLWILGFIIFATGAYGYIRYNTPLNPLSVFAVIEAGLLMLFSAWIAYTLQPVADYTSDDMVKTAMVSVVYILGVTSPFLFFGHVLAQIFGQFLRLLKLNSESIGRRFQPGKFALLIGGWAISFTALAILGGGGTLWLTDSRMAYQFYRAGVGPFFASTQWFLTFAFLYYLWSHRPRLLKLLLLLGLFSFPIYLMGSKNNILTLYIIGVVYYNYFVKRISFAAFMIITPLFVLAVFGLLIMYGLNSSLLEIVAYFQDYFMTTTQFIARFNEFSFLYGKGWLSSFWFYVPRGLYSGKPYEYGAVLIQGLLFPGTAATGHTLGMLPWTLAYLDFGVVGVFTAGVTKGLWLRMAYEHFLRHKQSFFAFLCMLQFSIWPFLTFAPLVIFIIWNVSQSVFLRLVWHYRRLPIQEGPTGGNVR